MEMAVRMARKMLLDDRHFLKYRVFLAVQDSSIGDLVTHSVSK